MFANGMSGEGVTKDSVKAENLQAQMPVVTSRYDGGVAYFEMRDIATFRLSADFGAALLQLLGDAQQDPSIDVICLKICGAKRFDMFGAADAQAARSVPSASSLSDICSAIEQSAKPVVATLVGQVFDFGLALALAAHSRVCDVKMQLGSLDLTLGLVPTGGITQRLPRRVGASSALNIMLSQKMLTAIQAQALGICDAVFEVRHQNTLADFCEKSRQKNPKQLRSRDARDGLVDAAAFMDVVTRRRKRLQSHPVAASRLIIDCVEAALLLPSEAGLMREDIARKDTCESPQSLALTHVVEEKARLEAASCAAILPQRPITKIGIFGTTHMAISIAKCALDHGFEVTFIDTDANQAAVAQSKITRAYEQAELVGHLSTAEKRRILAGFSGARNVEACVACDLVIEATSLAKAQRARLLSRIEAVVPNDTVLATIADHGHAEMASALSYPARFVGLHFLAPVSKVDVVELAQHIETSPDVIGAVRVALWKMRKIAVDVVARDGLVANVIEREAWRAVETLLLMGVRPSQIDRAMENYGLPTGPCAHMDTIGLSFFSGPVTKALCAAGRVGRGGTGGFYDYVLTQEGPKRADDRAAVAVIATLTSDGGRDEAMSDAEICERIVLAQANAGVRVLQEGVIASAADIDVLMVQGKNFPQWRGGPMWAAHVVGPMVAVNKLNKYAMDAQNIWAPTSYWSDLTKAGIFGISE